MADRKLSASTELSGTPADGDLIPVTDVSDTTDGAGGTTKKYLYSSLKALFQAANAVLTTLAGASANGQSLVTAANYAAMRGLLDLEGGTDFPSYATGTTASSATPTPPGAATRTHYTITALAAAAELQAPSGSAVDGNMILLRIKDNATPRALTYNAIYRAMGTALPSTTVASKTLYMLFIYNSAATKWDLVSAAQEA